MEEAASGIDCQETKLHQVLEEIREKEEAATDVRSLQDDNKKTEKVQQRSTVTEQLSVWVKPRKGMLRNKTKSPDGKERKKINVGGGAISERKVRKRECAEKAGFKVETKGAESKGGYDENASTTTAAAGSAYALPVLAKGQNKKS